MKANSFFLCAFALVLTITQQTAAAPGGYHNGYGLTRRSPLIAPSGFGRGRANAKGNGSGNNSGLTKSSRSHSKCKLQPIKVNGKFSSVSTKLYFHGLPSQAQMYNIELTVGGSSTQTVLKSVTLSAMSLNSVTFQTSALTPYVGGDTLQVTLTEIHTKKKCQFAGQVEIQCVNPLDIVQLECDYQPQWNSHSPFSNSDGTVTCTPTNGVVNQGDKITIISNLYDKEVSVRCNPVGNGEISCAVPSGFITPDTTSLTLTIYDQTAKCPSGVGTALCGGPPPPPPPPPPTCHSVSAPFTVTVNAATSSLTVTGNTTQIGTAPGQAVLEVGGFLFTTYPITLTAYENIFLQLAGVQDASLKSSTNASCILQDATFTPNPTCTITSKNGQIVPPPNGVFSSTAAGDQAFESSWPSYLALFVFTNVPSQQPLAVLLTSGGDVPASEFVNYSGFQTGIYLIFNDGCPQGAGNFTVNAT